MQHYFLNHSLQVGQIIELPNDVSHHWNGVMRAERGSKAEFVSNQEIVYVGELVDEATPTIKITEKTNQNVELPVRVTIVCGLPKGSKADLITQKATEMGADRIVFTPTDWAIAKWGSKAPKKIKRLQKIAKSAAEQSHRNLIPDVKYVDSINHVSKIKSDCKVMAYEEAAKHGENSKLYKIVSQMKTGQDLMVFFGPEGGISPSEVEELENVGFVSVGLGPRILRTESAPLYLLSAVSTLLELKQTK